MGSAYIAFTDDAVVTDWSAINCVDLHDGIQKGGGGHMFPEYIRPDNDTAVVGFTAADDSGVPVGASISGVTLWCWVGTTSFLTGYVRPRMGGFSVGVNYETQGQQSDWDSPFGGAVAQYFATNPLTGNPWLRSEIYDPSQFGLGAVAGSPDIAVYEYYLEVVFTAPNPTSIAPTSGSIDGGTPVTITGTDLQDVNSVTFDGTAATSVVAVDGTTVTCVTPAHAAGAVDVVVSDGGLSGTLSGGYTYEEYWWQLDELGYKRKKGAKPDAWTPPAYDFLDYTLDWEVIGTPPDDHGWWVSTNVNFGGDADLVDNGVPRNPRGWDKLASFSQILGGTPSCVHKNKLYYPYDTYTLGTEVPPIHVFDGVFDRRIVTLPTDAAGSVPRALVSMLCANGTIFLSTFDSGGVGTAKGRVFILNPETGTLQQLGTQITGFPYALAWHMNRLWVGTHNGDTTAGKVLFIRPNIDTDWTTDYDLTTASMAGVTSLASFGGLLYVGCDAAAGTFAKVLVRSSLAVYSASLTGSGGTAAANNGFLALSEFGGALYASFYNPDTPAVSKIYQNLSNAWSAVKTLTTPAPIIAFPTDQSKIFALVGGVSVTPQIHESADGSSWTDRSAFLEQSDPACTAVPVWGVVVR